MRTQVTPSRSRRFGGRSIQADHGRSSHKISAPAATAVADSGNGDHGWLTQIVPVSATNPQRAPVPVRSLTTWHRGRSKFPPPRETRLDENRARYRVPQPEPHQRSARPQGQVRPMGNKVQYPVAQNKPSQHHAGAPGAEHLPPDEPGKSRPDDHRQQTVAPWDRRRRRDR